GSSSSKSDSFTRKDLRDIFRIDPNTPCNTHDLLECPCEGNVVFEDPPPMEDDEDEDPDTEQGFVKACDVKPEHIDKMDRVYLLKKKAGLAALGEWKHINCLRASTRDDIQDDALRKLIDFHDLPTDRDGFSLPKSRLETLLSTIDVHNITALDKCLTTRDVPGGTVSYIFQKSSTSTIDSAGSNEDVP
ncbi:hypothetical protein DXG01_010190, partial [Tephrocybe rancida]